MGKYVEVVYAHNEENWPFDTTRRRSSSFECGSLAQKGFEPGAMRPTERAVESG